MSFKRQDHYYKQAKREGYRSRSAYKLKQIQKKFKVIRRGHYVLDLGAAPGGWTQVAFEYIGNKGKIIAIDKNPIRGFDKENIVILQMDIQSPALERYLKESGESINIVISDLAGNTSGNWTLDSDRQIFLANLAFKTARQYLIKGGNFVTKVFRGAELKNFEKKLKTKFESVKHWRPPATRKQSAEEYIICKNYLGE